MGSSLCRFIRAWLPLAAVLLATAACMPERPNLHGVTQATLELTAASPGSLGIFGKHRHVWLIDADQHSMDVWIEVLDADGRRLHAFDSPSRRAGSERVAVLLPQGRYTIRINSAEHAGKEARVAVRIERSDALEEPVDDPWLRAELKEAAAAAAFRAGSATDGPASLVLYRETAREWRRLGQDVRAATARYRSAWVSYRLLSDPANASAEAQSVAREFARESEVSLQASSLLLASSARNDMESVAGNGAERRLEQSRRETSQALALYEELRDTYGAAEATQVIAQTEYCAGNFSRARDLFRKAEIMYRDLDEREGLSRALVNAAQMDFALGNFREAVATYDRIFAARVTEARPPMHADMLDNSAHARMLVGNFEDSLRQYMQALQIHEDVHDAGGVGRSLHGIGITYLGLKNSERALEYLQRAADARKNAGDGAQVIASMLSLGDVHRDLGNTDAAIAAHTEARRYAQTPMERSRVSLAIARDYIANRQYPQAESLLLSVLGGTESMDSGWIAAQARLETARVKLALGQPAAALPLLSSVAATFNRGGALVREAEALQLMAVAKRLMGEPQNALRYANAAMQLVERIRASATNPEWRARFLATQREIYDLRVNVLLDEYLAATTAADRSDRLIEALSASELIRARSLVDRLEAGSVSARSDTSDHSRQLAEDIAAKAYRLEALSSADRQAALAQSVRHDLAELRTRYEAETRQLPVGQSAPFGPTERVPWRDLPRDVAILTYFVSSERSWLWSVTSDGVRGHELPARSVIVEAIRQAHTLLARTFSRGSTDVDLARYLHRLSSLLLPADHSLHSRSSWIVVADGSVASAPFSALYVREDRRVIKDHDVAFAMTYRAAERAARRPATLVLPADRPSLLFADPVYGQSDKRIVGPARAAVLSPKEIRRLPGTLREVSLIAEQLGSARPQVLLGFDASREAALSETARNAPLLHFATHARSDPRRMESAAVLLSGFDRTGERRNGLLTLNDLTAIKLSADLVVLSGCDSALGMDIDGEGSMSLAYGFLAAGAKAVIATEWQVADSAMTRLMDRFYTRAIAEGQPLPRALRAAQLELMQASGWGDPTSWAATKVVLSL